MAMSRRFTESEVFKNEGGRLGIEASMNGRKRSRLSSQLSYAAAPAAFLRRSVVVPCSIGLRARIVVPSCAFE